MVVPHKCKRKSKTDAAFAGPLKLSPLILYLLRVNAQAQWDLCISSVSVAGSISRSKSRLVPPFPHFTGSLLSAKFVKKLIPL